MTTPPPTILILGCSFSGLAVSHKLLRSLPADYKVVVVNPSTELYWNFASPRVVAKPDQFSSPVFASIVSGFSAYPATRFEFIQGTATSVDPAANTVTITPTDNEGNTAPPRTVPYTHLIVATGASAHNDWPFKPLATHAATLRAISDSQVRIEAAKTIVLSGAGATGVETAGEIATLWRGKGKKVILISSADQVLPGLRADVAAEAAKQLRSLNVELKLGTRVTAEKPDANGATELTLANGETINADLHIPTFGLTPNTSFLPADLLDETRSVKVKPSMQSPVHANIWATGDAAGVREKKNLTAKIMGEITVHNVLATVEGKGAETFKEYKQEPTPIVVPIGGGFAMGTGLLGSWRVWGFVVWLLKGRGFFLGSLKSVAAGKTYAGGQKL